MQPEAESKGVSHCWDTAEDVQFSDTTLLGADPGSPSRPSSRTQNSTRQSEPTRGRGAEKRTAVQHSVSENLRSDVCLLLHLQSVVFCVHYGGNTDEHGVPPIDSFYFHPHLETMERSLQTE